MIMLKELKNGAITVLFLILVVSLVFGAGVFVARDFIDVVKKGDVGAVKMSIASGANVNCVDQKGIPALIWAAKSGKVEIVKLLLDAGADVNAKTPSGTTALMTASLTGNAWVVQALLTPPVSKLSGTPQTVDVNAKDNRGNTALFFALRGKYDTVVAWLRWAGAK